MNEVISVDFISKTGPHMRKEEAEIAWLLV